MACQKGWSMVLVSSTLLVMIGEEHQGREVQQQGRSGRALFQLLVCVWNSVRRHLREVRSLGSHLGLETLG